MELTCDLRSHTHRLRQDSFRFFNENPVRLRFVVQSESDFSLTVDGKHLQERGSEAVLFHGHLMATSFLVALNIATLGYFSWRSQPSMHAVYHFRSSADDEGRYIALLQEKVASFGEVRDLTDEDTRRALIIFGSIAKDEDPESRIEYLKGLLHLGTSHLDFDFLRDAFGNFYRCVAGFVTRRILEVKQLQNEVKDIQAGLAKVGMSEEIQAEFKALYQIRSNQVAHAQKAQVAIAQDDALKAKAFADIVMYKIYRQCAEEWRAARA